LIPEKLIVSQLVSSTPVKEPRESRQDPYILF